MVPMIRGSQGILISHGKSLEVEENLEEQGKVRESLEVQNLAPESMKIIPFSYQNIKKFLGQEGQCPLHRHLLQ